MKCPDWLLVALEKGEGVECDVGIEEQHGTEQALVVGFDTSHEIDPYIGLNYVRYTYARPWRPAVGDAVFYSEQDEVLVARVVGVDHDAVSGLDVTIITTTGYTIHCWEHEVKKFNSAKVGLAWEDI